MFRQAKHADPEGLEAQYGYARTLHALHLYEEAIAAYEAALGLPEADDAVRTDYISALTWGGLLKGDRRWLAKAIQKARDALRENPNRVAIYASLQTALREAKPDTGYLETLLSLRKTHPQSPVLAIKLHEARLQRAQQSADSLQVAAVKKELRAELARWSSEDASPAILYATANPKKN